MSTWERSPEPLGFLDLPLELQRKIYKCIAPEAAELAVNPALALRSGRLVVTGVEKVTVHDFNDTHCDIAGLASLGPQIASELSVTLWSRNTVKVTAHDFEFKVLKNVPSLCVKFKLAVCLSTVISLPELKALDFKWVLMNVDAASIIFLLRLGLKSLNRGVERKRGGKRSGEDERLGLRRLELELVEGKDTLRAEKMWIFISQEGVPPPADVFENPVLKKEELREVFIAAVQDLWPVSDRLEEWDEAVTVSFRDTDRPDCPAKVATIWPAILDALRAQRPTPNAYRRSLEAVEIRKCLSRVIKPANRVDACDMGSTIQWAGVFPTSGTLSHQDALRVFSGRSGW